MQSIITFIQGFLNRKGAYVVLSQIIQKGLNFFTAVLVIRILSKEDYGLVVYAIAVLAAVLPFVGGGILQSLMRYGARLGSFRARKQLTQFSFRRGLIYSSILLIILIIASPLITAKLPKGLPYFYIITFQLIGLLFYETVSWYLRIVHLNKAFSYLQIQQGIGMFIGNILAAYFFGALGFALSTVLIPFLLALFWMKKINFFSVQAKYLVTNTSKKEYFNYGFFTSLGGIAAQLLFTVDILVISFLLADAESIAFYKASSMIPFALLFIPTGFILTDFVTLVKESKNKEYLVNYYKNFAKVFFTLSSILFVVMWLFSSEIMQLFGDKYANDISILPIFAFGLIGGMSIRIPMGNLLSAVGWARINALFSSILLILNLLLNYFLVKKYGIIGAAWATSGLMWFSGIISFIAFKIYLKKL